MSIKISQKFSEKLQMAAFKLRTFFLQVSELNNKLDELSLKGWICPCPQTAAFSLFIKFYKTFASGCFEKVALYLIHQIL